MAEDKETYRRRQDDIDYLEGVWFELSVLRNSEILTPAQLEEIDRAFQIVTKLYKQFDQFKLSQKYNWILTRDKHHSVKNKETHINKLEINWLILTMLRHSKVFTPVQLEEANEACKIIEGVFRQFDLSKFYSDAGFFKNGK